MALICWQYAGRTNLVNKGSDQNLGSLFADGNSGVLTKGTGIVVESTMGVVDASASEPCFSKETVRIEYERKLPRCETCTFFGHVHDQCPCLNDSSNILVSNPYACLNEDGREEVENVFDEYANLLSSAKLGESSLPRANEGRYILDGPLILNEVLAWYRQRKKELMVFKVNFEKAFDSLRWDFLDVILDKLGFGSKWRS
nr:RNA-directed DNA polymerase, eukaryota, reverse transcriptase zinc-binding domain protein [Tanacetum cinerariifolium]